MVFRTFVKTFLFTCFVSISLPSPALQERPTHTENTPIYIKPTGQAETQKWQKKKKKKPTIVQSWKKVVTGDWASLNKYDNRNLTMSAFALCAGYTFYYYCLRSAPVVNQEDNREKNSDTISPNDKKLNRKSNDLDNEELPLPIAIEKFNHAAKAITENRVTTVAAYCSTNKGLIGQQQANALCGLYATHNALTALTTIERLSPDILLSTDILQQAIIDNNELLTARMDTNNNSSDGTNNWLYTIATKRKYTAINRYVCRLLEQSIKLSKDEYKAMSWWQQWKYNYWGCTTRSANKNESKNIKLLSEIIATDLVNNKPINLSTITDTLQSKYDLLNPMHKNQPWYTSRINDIRDVCYKIDFNKLPHTPDNLFMLDENFLNHATYYIQKYYPADSSDLGGNWLDSGEITHILQDNAIQKDYALLAPINAHGRISVLETMPREGDEGDDGWLTINQIKIDLKKADRFCHGIILRTGNSDTQTTKSVSISSRLAHARNSIEAKCSNTEQRARMNAILTYIEKGRITSLDNNTILRQEFAKIVENFDPTKNSPNVTVLFENDTDFINCINQHKEDLDQFTRIFNTYDHTTAQANTAIAQQANTSFTHWICCIIFKPTLNSATQYYFIDSFNGVTTTSHIAQQLIEILEAPLP